MGEQDWLAARFEEQRPRLRAVAYRLLGSRGEADDAVQDAWLRASRADIADVANLNGWLTTIVARVCLNLLQARRARREEPLEAHPPDLIAGHAEGTNPEQEVLLADSVGLAMLVVLGALAPAERVAFVLHDVFAVPFDAIAPIVGRTPTATRQLASRARRRVRGGTAATEADLARQRALIAAFLAAARGGDFAALLAVLDPQVVLRNDPGADVAGQPSRVIGARAVAERAQTFARYAAATQPALVAGVPGIVAWGANGRPLSVLTFTIERGKIVAIDSLTTPARLERLALVAPDD